MSKRFTDTEKWRDPWFCALTSNEKLFWIFLLDTCNLAGIWQVNWPLVKFYVPDFEFKKASFEDRIQILSDSKWFIKKFPFFQYGQLQETNRMHQRILYELKKEGALTPHKHPSKGVKDMDKDKDKESLSLKYESFYSYYPRKIAPKKAKEAFFKIAPDEVLFQKILSALEIQKKTDQWTKDGGQFIPHPATWLNQRRWEDETPKSEDDLLREKWGKLNANADRIIADSGKSVRSGN